MKAATPPRRWASAMTCWQTVVLPDDSGPKISVIRPRGMPPTPSARSRAMEPVGMDSTCWRSCEPSFMIEPRPNCFSIARIAASTALPRSPFARAALRSSVIAMVRSLLIAPETGRPTDPDRPVAGSALVGLLFVLDRLRLAGLPDDLDLHRRLHHRLHLGQAGLVLRLLLGFSMRTVSRAHLFASASSCRLPNDPSRGLYRACTAARSARAQAQFRHRSRKGSGPDRSSDPDHEV